MQVFNPNLKTVIQNRVNAVTGSTPLRDLMVLAKAARGLGIDTTTLEVQINARLNSLNGSAVLTDLLVGSAASTAIPDSVGAVTTQNAVRAGDPMWVDAAGVVYGGNKYRADVGSHTGGKHSGLSIYSVSHSEGYNNSGQNQSFNGGTTVLSDGRILTFEHDGSGGGGEIQMRFRLFDSSLRSVNSNLLTLQLVSTLGSVSFYSQFIAMYKVAANSYRLYYFTDIGSGGGRAGIVFIPLTYNPATLVLTAGTRTVVQSQGSGDRNYNLVTNVKATSDRYGLINRSEDNYHFILDFATGTMTEVSALRGVNGVFATEWVGSGTDFVCWARFNNGSQQAVMVRSNGTTVNAPAALSGGYFLGYQTGVAVAQLSRGVLLAISSGFLSLAVLNTDFTSVTVTVISTAPEIQSSFAILIRNGQRIYVYNQNRSCFSFEVSATNVPSGFRFEDNTLFYRPDAFYDRTSTGQRIMRILGQSPTVLEINQEWFIIASFSNYSASGHLFRAPLVELMKMPVTFIGTAMTDAVAGAVCMVALDPKVQAASAQTWDLHAPFFGGYRKAVEPTVKPLCEILTGSFTEFPEIFNIHRRGGVQKIADSANPVYRVPAGQGCIYAEGSSPALTVYAATIHGMYWRSGGGSNGLTYQSEFPLIVACHTGNASNATLTVL